MADTTKSTRCELATMGFVRVDGLLTRTLPEITDGNVISRPMQDNHGYRDFGGGLMVLYPANTTEVWISTNATDCAFLRGLCPIVGAPIPLNDNEIFLSWELLQRFGDPDWIPKQVPHFETAE